MITGITIERREPLAGGAAFGAAGPYEKLVGRARGEIDPTLPANRVIAGLDFAARNASGRVAYETDLYILRPAEPARGNGRLLYEAVNRGRKLLFGNLCAGTVGINDPQTAADLGNALPLRRGFTLVWSGWDADAPRAAGGLAMEAPVAAADGIPLVREVRDEFCSGTRGGVLETFRLSHPAATRDQAAASLALRQRREAPLAPLAAAEWEFVDDRRIRLLPAGRLPEPGAIYEFRYRATGARVLGLGLAATRDVVSHLRHEGAAEFAGRPLTHALAFGISQSARYLRDHIALGFNRDEAGRRVFDGVLAHTAGAGRVWLNELFAQPFRTRTAHEDFDYPENVAPFALAELFRGDGCDPLLLATNTSSEYWQKGASLLHTDAAGSRDLDLPGNARAYLLAGTQHGGRAGLPDDPGPYAARRNPHDPMPALRALLVALDEWVALGRAPPPSALPRLADGTLVAAEALGFPDLPGLAKPGEATAIAGGRPLVPAVDADGNERAGIRLPDIAVPVATYTGWNHYRAPYPAGVRGDRDGSFLPFARLPAERIAARDPRLSIAERYGDEAELRARRKAAVGELVRQRLLLAEDADRLA